jgi:ATP-dependent DNA ligase
MKIESETEVRRLDLLLFVYRRAGATESPIICSEHLRTDGNKMLAHACRLKFEGILSKNAEAPYRSERSDAWIKCSTSSAPNAAGSRPRSCTSLH